MRLYLRVSAILFLSACGGGTGSTPQERPAGDIVGTVFNAAVSGATVRAYSFAAGAKGELLGEAFTDPSGAFGISVNTPSGLVLLESTGGVYREAASGKDVTVPADVPMRSIVQYTTGVTLDTSISFYTGLATGLAEHLIGAGRAPPGAVAEAFGGFSSAMGLDIRGTTPVDITQAGDPTTPVTPRHEYGFFAAAVSRWSADAGATSVAFLKVAHEDIRADGKLDGKAGDVALKVGSVTLDVDVYRHNLAVALLKIADSPVNKTGLKPSQLMPAAKRWNDSTSAIFGPGDIEAIDPLDDTPPSVVILAPANGVALRRKVTALGAVTDNVSVKSATFLLDGTDLGNDKSATAPRITIDTKKYPDGIHVLTLRATDSSQNTVEASRELIFNNHGGGDDDEDEDD